MWFHTVTHGRGKGKLANGVGSRCPSHYLGTWVYPALLLLMRSPRLSVVDWTDAPADLIGLVRFAERRNLVSARVPSHFNWRLLGWLAGRRAVVWQMEVILIFWNFFLYAHCVPLWYNNIYLEHSLAPRAMFISEGRSMPFRCRSVHTFFRYSVAWPWSMAASCGEIQF